MTQPHTFDATLLRAYDIRGKVGETLHEADAYHLGLSFATVLSSDAVQAVAIGYDGRLHSPKLATALQRGFMESGIDVYDIGCVATPTTYFAGYHLPVQASIMVTGSHNPPEYNGFKMTLQNKPFYGDQIQALGQTAAKAAYCLAETHGTLHKTDISTAYLDRLLQDMHFGDKALKVAWDAGNGAAGALMTALTKRLPGTHILLNEVIDGTFPAHHPDPTEPENLEQLIDTVHQENCDFGIAFDGDGDRIGLVDADGHIIWGDQMLVLFADGILKQQPGATIIADVKASQVLFDEIAKRGGQPLMWKTGHSLIKSKMAETKSPLAGEMSGHVFFADRYEGYDDALYAAVRMLEYLSNSDLTLAQHRAQLPVVLNTPELRIPCSEEKKFSIIATLQQQLDDSKYEVSKIDGLRVKNAYGWWLLRASNTQDVLVARCEADTQENLDRLKQELAHYLEKAGLSSDFLKAA